MPDTELSLRDELEKGFDGGADAGEVDGGGADPAAPADGVVDAAPEIETEPSGDRPRGPDGRFLPKDADKGDDKAAGAPEPEAAGEGQAQAPAAPAEPDSPGVDLPPSTFTPAGKQAYLALPKDSPLRAEIKKREADYQKGIGQYKQAAESGSRLLAEIQPYMPLIQSEGGTPERAIKQLLNTAYQLRTLDPVSKGRLVMQIAQQYGADISQFAPKPGQPAQDGQAQQFDAQALVPVVQQLLQPHLQRFEQFSNQFTTAQQQRVQAEQQEAQTQVEAFRNAADEKGQPTHPYFDNVRDMMAAFLQSGHAQTMDQAYDMACRAHPEVSRAIDAAQRQTQEAQRLAEAKRKADEAKRAQAVNAEGQGGIGVASPTSNSLRDELEAAYDGTQRL